MKKEVIMAIENSNLNFFNQSGFIPAEKEVTDFLTIDSVWFGPRHILEENTDFRQIIPYAIVKTPDSILMYERPNTGGEKRLHGLKSIGFGGHIKVEDIQVDENEKLDIYNTIEESLMRELNEELKLDTIPVECFEEGEYIGYLYFDNESDYTKVNKVHLGLICVINVNDKFIENLKSCPIEIGNVEFIKIKDLENHIDNMEIWSQEVSKFLIK